MTTVGAYEAKTHLNKLLDLVAKGEKITITRHGVPIAVLQPVNVSARVPVRDTIEQLKQFRVGRRLGGLTVRELIEAGRRT